MEKEFMNDYLNRHYDNWLDYARFHCTRAGIPLDARDVLHEAIVALLEKPVDELIALAGRQYAAGTELDFLALRIIKLNATSPTSRHRYQPMLRHWADGVDVWSLSVVQEPQPASQPDPFERFEWVRRMLQELDIPEQWRAIFRYKFFLHHSLSDWPGKEKQRTVYGIYNRVLALLRAQAALLQQS